MRFTVGGEEYEFAREQIIAAMKNESVEPVQKYVVEIEGRAFPPKQVFATVTGRERQTFTTMEAQRVLTRLGFMCRRADEPDSGTAARELDSDRDPTVDARLAHIESALATADAAIAGLHLRVRELERAR